MVFLVIQVELGEELPDELFLLGVGQRGRERRRPYVQRKIRAYAEIAEESEAARYLRFGLVIRMGDEQEIVLLDDRDVLLELFFGKRPGGRVRGACDVQQRQHCEEREQDRNVPPDAVSVCSHR